MGASALSSLDKTIRSLHLGRDGIFILADANTRRHCLPLAIEKSASLGGAGVLEIDGGEDSKTLETAAKLWKELLAMGAGRQSLLVNLGGGVVSDLGGFVAAGYKRGIGYINVPTSLMGQCDAAIGGKTAVNIGQIKNQVGFFYPSKGTFIFPGFLKTLPAEHIRSGLAEIIKSALIGNDRLWRRMISHPVTELLSLPAEDVFWQEMLTGAVKFKNRVVTQDFREKKLRKVLNFGHTIGHALETYSMTGPRLPMLHGEAVAAGMICAAFLSQLKAGLTTSETEAIKAYISEGFPDLPKDVSSVADIVKIMGHDKKNRDGQLQFTLISKPGSAVVNIPCNQAEIEGALNYLTAQIGRAHV